MIQPPLEICRERKWETAAVAFAVVVVIGLPIALTVLALCAQASATQWLSSYTPIVYLEPGTTPDQADALAAEVSGWSLTESAEVRTPEAAHEVLRTRLGEDLVTELGIAPTMLPAAIVIEPALPIVGHIDLVARVAGLEARMEVDAVEVPSSDAMQVVTVAGVVLVAAAALALFGLLAAMALLLAYLRRLRSAEADTDRVVALFGGYASDLRRPTFVRGVIVASGAGVMISLGGALALLMFQLWSVHLVGTAVSPSMVAWAVVAAPVLAMPIVGFVAAWFASREPIAIWRRAHA